MVCSSHAAHVSCMVHASSALVIQKFGIATKLRQKADNPGDATLAGVVHWSFIGITGCIGICPCLQQDVCNFEVPTQACTVKSCESIPAWSIKTGKQVVKDKGKVLVLLCSFSDQCLLRQLCVSSPGHELNQLMHNCYYLQGIQTSAGFLPE